MKREFKCPECGKTDVRIDRVNDGTIGKEKVGIHCNKCHVNKEVSPSKDELIALLFNTWKYEKNKQAGDLLEIKDDLAREKHHIKKVSETIKKLVGVRRYNEELVLKDIERLVK